MSAASSNGRRTDKRVRRKRPSTARHDTARLASDETYWQVARRPLQVLIFLLPLVAMYELAMISILRVGDIQYFNLAHRSLVRFFDVFGLERAGWYLPGVALIVVLLAWQALAREPWRIHGRALLLMLVESIVLACPLILLATIAMTFGGDDPSVTMSAGAPVVGPPGLLGKIAGSIGAGIYEELVFRMLVIGLVHTLLVDIAKVKRGAGTVVAVIVSAVIFMMYHWIGQDVDSIPIGQNVFYILAGVYFGLLFVMRGFGIVVAAHAIYDILVALFLDAA